MSTSYDFLFGEDPDELDEPMNEPETEADHAAASAAVAAAQDAEVRAAADAYEALLPAIRAARPQAPRYQDAVQLTGADWIVDRLRALLTPADPNRFSVEVFTREDAVVVEVTAHVLVNRRELACFLAHRIAEQENLGIFEAAPAADPSKFFLIRRGAIDTSFGWRGHGPRAAAFFENRDGQRRVFDLAKVFQTNRRTKQRRYPKVHAWGEDDRGGWAELRLPPGMLLDTVRAHEAGFRQALNAPDLVVDSVGVYPILRLNTREVVRQFPKQNPLVAGRMYLPRTEAERYACSAHIRLFLGVTETGAVVAPKLKDRSHAAIFGMTNSGKSTAMVTIARSLAAQGAEVWLLDAKGTPEFRSLYKEGVPGITHLSVATPALMHATVHKLRELYRFRAAVANELADRGLTVDDIIWPRVVCIFDEMGEFLNTALSDGGDPVAQEQAKVTVNMLGEIGAKARAYGVHMIVAGQHVYVAALPNKVKEHLSVRVVFGKASDTHVQRLFDEQDRDGAKAAREGILPGMKGRGIVLADEGDAVQFQSFHNDTEAAAAFAKAAAGTPRLIRWAHKFPVGEDVPGAHGEWQSWGGWEGNSKYEMTGTVEDIGTVALDRRDPVTGQIEYDAGAGAWDMLNRRAYSPGSPPRSKAFTNVN